jgi:hypothetical protein
MVCSLLPIILLKPAASNGQTDVCGIAVGPIVELADFPDFDLVGSGLAFGGRIEIAYFEPWVMEASAAVLSFEQRFETPTGTSGMAVDGWWVELGLSHVILELSDSWAASVRFGSGVRTLGRPSTTISLGALGNQTLPPVHESNLYILTGMRLRYDVGAGISIDLGPGVKWIEPFSSGRTEYTITGGLLLDLL